jgi:hypothetical protein
MQKVTKLVNEEIGFVRDKDICFESFSNILIENTLAFYNMVLASPKRQSPPKSFLTTGLLDTLTKLCPVTSKVGFFTEERQKRIYLG